MLVGLLFATIAVLFPVTAQATPSPTADTGQAQAIGNCLKANKVWVFVITAEDKVLANQCVSSPASGADALKKAGVAVQKSKTGLICTMNDHRCMRDIAAEEVVEIAQRVLAQINAR